MTHVTDNFEPRDRIEAELAALGEPDLSPDELDGLEVGDPPDVVVVQTLVALAQMASPREAPLGELGGRRVWQRIDAKRGARRSGFGTPEAPSTQGPAPGRWGVLLMAVGVAAAMVVVPWLSTPTRDDTAVSPRLTEALSEQVRMGLEVFDGPSGAARAQSMAREYAERWQRRGGDANADGGPS